MGEGRIPLDRPNGYSTAFVGKGSQFHGYLRRRWFVVLIDSRLNLKSIFCEEKGSVNVM